jgi:hypothetical protein
LICDPPYLRLLDVSHNFWPLQPILTSNMTGLQQSLLIRTKVILIDLPSSFFPFVVMGLELRPSP